jgi:hypothetical protein
MLAETANVDCRFILADQGKQTSLFCFPFAENKQKFAISVSVWSKQTQVAVLR